MPVVVLTGVGALQVVTHILERIGSKKRIDPGHLAEGAGERLDQGGIDVFPVGAAADTQIGGLLDRFLDVLMLADPARILLVGPGLETLDHFPADPGCQGIVDFKDEAVRFYFPDLVRVYGIFLALIGHGVFRVWGKSEWLPAGCRSARRFRRPVPDVIRGLAGETEFGVEHFTAGVDVHTDNIRQPVEDVCGHKLGERMVAGAE